MKKPFITSAIVLTVLAAGLTTVPSAFAQDNQPQPPLVQRIADKFGLNKADVQAVFDQFRQDHMANRETAYEARLSELVTQGKITDSQKQLLLTKHKELVANRQAEMDKLKNMTPEQRQSEKQTQAQALQDWAKQNGIDAKYLFGGLGFGKRFYHLKN